MGLPRREYINEGEEGVYHCFSRCVRRAHLCGYDALTGRDFSHRKKWIVDRLHYLASIFAIEVCAYAVMENHPHSILRTRPDILATWSDQEVASRWLTLCPQTHRFKKKQAPPLEEQIKALASYTERIAILRKRLCSLSWFMAKLNEYIARKANKEDKVTGRFWEGRFKCQVLLDGAAIVACMVYVDLNVIRAGTSSPEESDFTSIQARIRAWKKENAALDSHPKEKTQVIQSAFAGEESSRLNPSNPLALENSPLFGSSDYWLCPIQSTSSRRGILEISTLDYFNLVDRSGRIIRSNKQGFIDNDLEPILVRIGAIPKAWGETVSQFGSAFGLVAGKLIEMRKFANRLNRNWFKGLAIARSAFA
jgi:hypothetical protein